MTSKLQSKYRHLVKKAGYVRGLLFTNYIVFRKKRKIICSPAYKTMADASEEADACAVEGRTNKRRGREKKTLAKNALVYMLSNLPNGPSPFH